MLRKRTRSHQKDQNMNNLIPDSISESYFRSDVSNQKHKNNSLLKVHGLFVGLNPRNSECDSVRSPTSPLDYRIFSSLGSPFRCLRAQTEGQQKSWDCRKVGLSIIDSLDDEPYEKGNWSSDNKNILLVRQMSVRNPTFCSSLESPKSLPKNVAIFPSSLAKPGNPRRSDSDVVFEIGEASFETEAIGNLRARSVDSGRCGSHLMNFGSHKSRLGVSGNFAVENTTIPLEAEACGSIRAHSVDSGRCGSHLMDFGNRKSRLGGSGNFAVENTTIPLGSFPPSGNNFIPCSGEKLSSIELSEDYTCVRTHGPNPKVTHIFGDCILECHNNDPTLIWKYSEAPALPPYPSEDFLKFCYSCQKKLDGEDIYMYRGEKAFCSSSCRSREIEVVEKVVEEEKANVCEEASSSLFV